MSTSNSISKSKSASTLLGVVRSHNASDVMEFTANKASRVCTGNYRRPPSSAIVIDSKMTPLEAATLLWENNIMGALVYDAAAKSYLGMFDVRDILSCVTVAHREFLAMAGHRKPGDDTCVPRDVEAHRNEQSELMAKALRHVKTNSKPSVPVPGAVTVPYLAARNPAPPFYSADDSLLDICRTLAGRHQHRVPIADSSSGSPVCKGMISQSGLVAFIASRCPKGSLDERMVDAGLPFRKDVVQVSGDASAATAFDILDSKRLSGIAVVDEDGRLIGNTSARDIKNTVMDAGRINMDMDILSYLAQVRQSELVKNDRYPSCHVHEDATVGHVVNLLAKTGYHRVFVVDHDLRPIGVVSFADIITFFTEME